ncbi:hypothetical protein IIC65_06325, partial [Candidatus Sumerlaeota bacterium]|nr:hypothetical protein [Candidatus Sumerlaeota bacterium]
MNAWFNLESAWSGQVLTVLGHFIWQGALIGMAAAVGAFLLRRSRPELRYAMYVCAFAAMALCIPATFVLTGEPGQADKDFLAAAGEFESGTMAAGSEFDGGSVNRSSTGERTTPLAQMSPA